MSSTRALPCFALSRMKFSLSISAAAATLAALLGFAGQAGAQCSGAGTTTYNSTGGVSVAGGTISTSTNNINVSVPAGSVVTCVSVILNGVTSNGYQQSPTGDPYSSMAWASFLLTAPSGQKLEFLGSTGDATDGDDTGEGPGSGVSNLTITVADGAASAAPGPNNGWQHTCSGSNCPVVKPSSYYLASDQGNPPLGSSSQWPQSDGSATFANQFNSVASPSGNWTLTLTDNNSYTHGDPVSVSSWSLVITTEQTANVNTSTAVSSNSTNDTSFTSGSNSAVTLTATVTASGSPVDAGTVNFNDGGNTISCSGGNQTLSNGHATCVTTLTTEGIHSLGASFSGATGYNPSSASPLNQFVKNHSTLNGGEYCNPGTLTVYSGQAVPYPSVVNVGTDTSALSGTVANVTVTLDGFSAAELSEGYAFLLVAPDNSKAYNLDFLAGSGSGSQSSVNVSIADSYPAAPVNGSLSSTTYEATDRDRTADPFVASVAPAPSLPGTINYAQPDTFGNNALTMAGAFGGANGSGDWTLFAYNDLGQTITVNNGWCLAFEVNNGSPTTTAITSSANPQWTGSSVTLTATVTSNGNPVSSGTVTMTDNSTGTTLVSNATPNASGQVSYTSSSFTEGDHNITAVYSGVNNNLDPSSSSPFWQRLNTATTMSGAGTSASPAVFCNPGGITLPNQLNAVNNGAAAPNPSNIFVNNLPGTVGSVQVELENFQNPPGEEADTMLWTSSLLVGPGAAPANTLDFFTGTGTTDNDSLWPAGNYIFADNGSEPVPQANYGPGTYQPTSYVNGQIAPGFTASPSGFYTLPGSFQYAQPFSPAYTFGDVYGNTNADGTWSLYMYQNTAVDGPGATANGWCVSFIQNLPTVSATASHNGSISSGQQSAQLTVAITNNGPGSTGDFSGSNPLTVTDVLNAAFTYSSFAGSGWSCSSSGQTVTCTNDSPVAASSSYNPLTIDVNVSGSASGGASNSFTVSGAGVASTPSNVDSFTIDTAPAITSSASTSFTVGAAGSFAVTTTGTPAPSLGYSGTLPTGVSFTDNGNGTATLAGTPAAGSGGTYPIVITAQNGTTPNATQNFSLTVSQGLAITSANKTTFTVGTAASFTVTTSGYPVPALSETGSLPGGVTFTDNGNGTATLAGTASAPGSFPITIKASNGVSNAVTQNFTLAANPVLAQLTSPTQGSTLPGASVTFTWAGGAPATYYQIMAGTWGPGAGDIYDSHAISHTATSQTVTLPTGGITLYVTFSEEINGVWYGTNYTFTEAGTTVPAAISSPSPGSVLTTTTPTFSWAGVNGPNEFSLRVGTSGVSTSDIYYSGALFGVTSQTVTLPANGQKILVELGQLYNGTWTTSSYTYTEPGTPATITSPTPGSLLPSQTVTFSWPGGKGVTDYQLLVGTTRPGSGQILNTYSTHETSATVNVPANGANVYVRLNQEIDGVWQATDYTYTAPGTLVPAVINTPTSGTTLTSTSVNFDWSGASAPVEYILDIGTTGKGSSDIYNSGGTTATNATVTVPSNGTTLYVRLYQIINNVWQSTDYTYTEP